MESQGKTQGELTMQTKTHVQGHYFSTTPKNSKNTGMFKNGSSVAKMMAYLYMGNYLFL